MSVFGSIRRSAPDGLSKGQRTQVALIAAVCPETDLLVLDEPTSGLDPIVRREFIEAVIGAYQQGNPGNRTILVSTHLITEFEGLIDEFTIIDQRPRRADARRRPGPRALSENPRALCAVRRRKSTSRRHCACAATAANWS